MIETKEKHAKPVLCDNKIVLTIELEAAGIELSSRFFVV
jgi:hypothetical protein